MEQQREVMRRVLGLADTTLEGLRHIQQRQLKGHHPDETTTLCADVVHAFAEIEEAIHRGLPPLDTGDLVAQTNTLREGLHWMTAAYEGNSDMRLLATLQFTLLPRFESWHEALQRVIRPHFAS